MRLYFCLFLIISSSIAWRSRRLRRQLLPSQHVQVHSIESGVILDGGVFVESGENRIDIDEQYLNGSMWSDHSLLNFNNEDTFSNVTADNPESLFNLQGHVQVHAQGLKGDFFVHTNRSTDGHSSVKHGVYGGANFSFDDGVMRVQGVQGKRVGVEAETWDRDIERTITLEADTAADGDRELRLEATAKPYHAVICFVGAVVYFQYAGKYIKLEPTYTFIEISTDKYTLTTKSQNAPFHVTLANNDIVIKLPAENTRVCVYEDGILVQSSQLTKTHIDRNGGKMTIGGKPIPADGVMITALTTELEMSNAGLVNSDTHNSHVLIENNVQSVGLTARHHNLKVNDGIPHIIIDPGLSVVEIKTNHGVFSLDSLMAPFRPRDDKFVDIGPFRTATGYGPPHALAPPPPPPHRMAPPVALALPAPVAPPPSSPMAPSVPMANLPPSNPVHGPPAPFVPPPAMLPPPIPFQESGMPPIPPPPPPIPRPPSTFGGVMGIPPDLAGFAADLPVPKRIANESMKTTTVEEKLTNVTTVTSSHEATKKKGVKLDPLLAMAMAADLPPVIKSEPRSEATPSTVLQTTTLPAVSIDSSLHGNQTLKRAKGGRRSGSSTDITTVEENEKNVTTTLTNKKEKYILPSPNSEKSSAAPPRTASTLATTMIPEVTPKAVPSAVKIIGIDEQSRTTVEENETNSTTSFTSKNKGMPLDPLLLKTMAADIPRSPIPVGQGVANQKEKNKMLSVNSSNSGISDSNLTTVDEREKNTTTILKEELKKDGVFPTQDSLHSTKSDFEDRKEKNQTGRRSSKSLDSMIKTVENISNTTKVETLVQKQDAAASPPPTTESSTHKTTVMTTTPATTTTVRVTTTTTLSPMEELKKLREEMLKMKKIREWEEQEVSNDGDGDEHVEEFTYPNGSTVHRVVKTRRRITTTITHKHREEVNDTQSSGNSTVVAPGVDLSKANFTLLPPLTSTTSTKSNSQLNSTQEGTHSHRSGTSVSQRSFTRAPTIVRKSSVTRTMEIPVGAK